MEKPAQTVNEAHDESLSKPKNAPGTTSVERTDYRGHDTITIWTHKEKGSFPFSFGKDKAQLIVKYFEEIKKFAEEK